MQDLGRMGVFAVVAEELSLSKAAEKLGSTKSAVSKQITALELELGVKLLYRSTRRSRLTDEGHALYQTCGEILERYHSVRSIAEQLKATPAGNLSLEMPDGIATYIVLPHIQKFRAQFPLIKLNLRLRQATFRRSLKTWTSPLWWGSYPIPQWSAVASANSAYSFVPVHNI